MEREELFACKMNMTNSAHCHCGIFPFNMECEGWTNVIESLGKLNKELRERAKDKGVSEYEVVVNTTAIITEEEKTLLTAEFPPSTHTNEAAYHILRKLLGTWRFEQITGDSHNNPTEQPMPSCAKEKLLSNSSQSPSDLNSLMG